MHYGKVFWCNRGRFFSMNCMPLTNLVVNWFVPVLPGACQRWLDFRARAHSANWTLSVDSVSSERSCWWNWKVSFCFAALSQIVLFTVNTSLIWFMQYSVCSASDHWIHSYCFLSMFTCSIPLALTTVLVVFVFFCLMFFPSVNFGTLWLRNVIVQWWNWITIVSTYLLLIAVTIRLMQWIGHQLQS